MSEYDDRGTSIYVWDSEFRTSFEPFEGGKPFCISVPIGFTLVSDPNYGVLLKNVMGQRFTSRRAFSLATEGGNIFRFKNHA
jgi:hypothetical protein